MSLITLKAISKHYQLGLETINALNKININIERNEYVAFTGSSGSGKSTMMNILGCMDKPSNGEYYLNEKKVSELNQDQLAEIRNKEIGFIFQSFHLLPRLSALQNVMQPLIYQGIPLATRKIRAQRVLDRVGLANRLSHLPNELSGGQRQRVAIARALVTKPSILLADEPTGNLDSKTSAEIMKLFDELHQEKHTIIIVTHENDIAQHCNRFINLSDGEIAQDHVSQ
ncbi:MAG: ABC transporter ATP-binding protein [Thiohalomonadales bacterium]